MQVTLLSKNHQREHTFNIVVRDDEILFTTPDGTEFASMRVETSETDILSPGRYADDDGPALGRYTTIPTNSFFLSYLPTQDSLAGKETAWVAVADEE